MIALRWLSDFLRYIYTTMKGLSLYYQVYSNGIQAKKVITISTFVRFSGKGHHTLHKDALQKA